MIAIYNRLLQLKRHLPLCARRLATLWFGLVALAAGSTAAQAADSVRLADVIRSNGSGSINLMMGTGSVPISAASLEALRQDHLDNSTAVPRRYLTLAIDVNENAKGMENSSAMGITVASVALTVTRPSGTTVYSNFRTRTQALLAPSGSTTRQRYYTALGEAGSSRLMANNIIQSTFDSTLDIFVPDSLADATSAVLSVTLLNVNKTLGDPESFYDYSGGYEDLALLNQADAYYLNAVLPGSTSFSTSAPVVEPVEGIISNDSEVAAANPMEPVSWAYYPSSTGWYKVAYEDNFPNKGDYDFNDAVVAYRYKLGLNSDGMVVRIEADTRLLAEGAWYTLDWHLRLPIAGTGQVSCSRLLPSAAAPEPCQATFQAGMMDALAYEQIDNTGRYFAAPGSWASNAVDGSPYRAGTNATIVVTLDAPVNINAIGIADPWLYVQDTGRAIHLGSNDGSGFPYAMLLPDAWKNPKETVDMGLAYGRLRNFVQTQGQQDQDWYIDPAPSLVFVTPSP